MWLLFEGQGGGGVLRPPHAINSFQALLVAPFVDGKNDRSSTGGVNLVRGCLINPSRLD
jgi:hypothetical protein